MSCGEAVPGGADQGLVEVEACKKGCELSKCTGFVDVQALKRGQKTGRGVWQRHACLGHVDNLRAPSSNAEIFVGLPVECNVRVLGSTVLSVDRDFNDMFLRVPTYHLGF